MCLPFSKQWHRFGTEDDQIRGVTLADADWKREFSQAWGRRTGIEPARDRICLSPFLKTATRLATSTRLQPFMPLLARECSSSLEQSGCLDP